MKPTTQELISHFRYKFPTSDMIIRFDAQKEQWFVHAMSAGYVGWMESQHLTGGPPHYSCWRPSLDDALMDCMAEYAKRIRL